MSKSITEIARHPARFGALLALVIMTLVVAAMNVSATPPSNFMEAGSTGGDKNVRDESAANPPFDWANSGTGAANTCPTATTGFTVVNLAGAGGLFNCGQGDGQFTTPIGPIPTADGTVGAHHIDASAFKVDPLASDQATCIDPKTGLQTKDGDPTTYTKTGGEKNGDSLVLNSSGSDAVETWSTASVPPKDDVSNVYAVSRSGFDPSNPTSDAASGNGKEVFFGAERIVNNGDTHMDFEFTQAAVGLSAGSPPGTCAGKFDGHRTHGDFIASIDYTTGGSIGTFSLAQWHCNTDTHSSDNSTGWVTAATNGSSLNGKLCDFASGSTCTVASTPGVRSDGGFTCGTGPHYQEIACFDANGPATNPSCPGAGSGDPNSVCNPIPAGGCAPGVPLDAIRAVTNGGPSETPAGPGPVACGGWACRTTNGTTTGPIGTCTASSCIDTNELMEGSVNLLSLGFTSCISTFIPHTRSSQSFTATTKDFEIIPFNTCKPSTSLSLSTSPTPNAGSDILVHKGDSVTFTFTDTNDSNLGTSALLNPSVSMSSTPVGATCTPVKTGGDTNNDGKLDLGESWVFSCSVTFNTAGSFTIKGTAHGTFNGSDVTFCADPTSPPANTICDQDEQVQIVVRVISPSTALTKSASPTTVRANLDTVTYTYRESNDSTGGNGTADLDLTSVSVSDDKCATLTRGLDDTGDNNNTLSVGETWVFICARTLAATTTNTATATGTDALGFTITFCTTAPNTTTICDAQEQAQATVTVISPSMSVTKAAAPKATVTYSYGESNTAAAGAGNDLTNPSVSDDKCSPVAQDLKVDGIHNTGDTNNDGKLNPGETFNFKCTTIVTLLDGTGTVSVQNTATATATDTLGNTLTETDKLTVNATISVTKP